MTAEVRGDGRTFSFTITLPTPEGGTVEELIELSDEKVRNPGRPRLPAVTTAATATTTRTSTRWRSSLPNGPPAASTARA